MFVKTEMLEFAMKFGLLTPLVALINRLKNLHNLRTLNFVIRALTGYIISHIHMVVPNWEMIFVIHKNCLQGSSVTRMQPAY